MDKTIYNKLCGTWNGKNWLLILVCLLAFSCSKDKNEVSVLFVGDILLSRNVKQEYNSRKTFPWEKLSNLFHSSDLVIGNLEGAVGVEEDRFNPLIKSPVFPIDSSDISMLNKAGFNVITIENNHILDLGVDGKKKTISALIENDIKPICFENSPNFIHVKDKVISIVSLNIVLNSDSTKYQIPSVELKQKMRLAKSLSNLVIISIHWGSELLEWPNKEQIAAAKWLVSNGADLIIGHHPHVIQKPELINGKPVFWSLGNHLFDQKYRDTKEGLIVEIKIKNESFQCSTQRTRTQKNSFYPEVYDSKKEVFKPICYNKDLFTINDFTIIPYTIDSENRTIIEAYKNTKRIWSSHPIPLVALQKIKIDDKAEHLFALENHYSSLDKEINIRPYVYSINNTGMEARWRGSALAWPILDAQVSPLNEKILCALHSGDAYIYPEKINDKTKIIAYSWNGFGFNALDDSTSCKYCEGVFEYTSK